MHARARCPSPARAGTRHRDPSDRTGISLRQPAAGFARPRRRRAIAGRINLLRRLRRGTGRAARDRRRDARIRQPADHRQRHRLPRGVLDALSGRACAVAVDSLAVRQRRGGRDGGCRGPAHQGEGRRARRRAGRRRRHCGHRFRLPVGDVRAQRRRALHLLRQRGLHELRRAALERDAAGGPHGDHVRRSARSRATRSAPARTCR